jgi:hypothetical protein
MPSPPPSTGKMVVFRATPTTPPPSTGTKVILRAMSNPPPSIGSKVVQRARRSPTAADNREQDRLASHAHLTAAAVNREQGRLPGHAQHTACDQVARPPPISELAYRTMDGVGVPRFL